MPSPCTSWPQRIALALLLAATAAPFSAPARAEDEDQEEFTFEQRIIRKLLGVDGADIDYRERSPLVIPPSGNLPPPSAAATAVKPSPAWPEDPDVVRRKQAAKSTKKQQTIDAAYESQRPLRPDELRQGTAAASPATAPVPNADINSTGRPLAPSEVGDGKNLLGFFGIGGGSTATAAAAPEPQSRTRLTQPPTAYRTPSTNQPYAAPKETGFLSKLNPFDRGTCEGKASC